MSDIIPPILSSTPPPLADIADDDDDFGDFAVADDPFQTDTPDPESGKKKFFCIIQTTKCNVLTNFRERDCVERRWLEQKHGQHKPGISVVWKY